MDVEVQTRNALQAWIQREYGLLIDSATVAKILGYRSAGSMTKARNRGHLALDMFSVPFRKGLYTSPEHLVACMQATIPHKYLQQAQGASDGRITAPDR